MRDSGLCVALLVLMLLGGCRGTPELQPLPTLIDIRSLPTQIALTQEAPPADAIDISVAPIDRDMALRDGWRIDFSVNFDGQYDRDNRAARADVQTSITYDQLGVARRVVADVDNLLPEQPVSTEYEAVQLGTDAFLIREDVCLNALEEAVQTANLTAGSLIGGVTDATASQQRATINGVPVWRYDFGLQDLVLPLIEPGERSQVEPISGELWYSPQYDAVIRYYLRVNVQQARVLGSLETVSGRLRIQYDVTDMDTIPSISVPFGC